MDVYVQAQIGPCSEFMLERKKQEISVAIAPLKIINEDQTLKIIFGCNYWRACENKNCQYSVLAKGPKKE